MDHYARSVLFNGVLGMKAEANIVLEPYIRRGWSQNEHVLADNHLVWSTLINDASDCSTAVNGN